MARKKATVGEQRAEAHGKEVALLYAAGALGEKASGVRWAEDLESRLRALALEWGRRARGLEPTRPATRRGGK